MLALAIIATVILALANFCAFAIRSSEDPECTIVLAILYLGPAALAITTIWVLYSKLF